MEQLGPCALTIGSLFSGIGGLDLGLERAGLGPVVFQVEQDPFCRAVLEKHWPNVDRSITDVRAASASVLPRVSILCGGFPCTDVSSAGKGAGLAGKHSGLWYEYLRIIGELAPPYVVVENVASGRKRWLCAVRSGLHELGYRTTALGVSAADVGAPHRRERIFVVAYADRGRSEGCNARRERAGQRAAQRGREALADADRDDVRVEQQRLPARRQGRVRDGAEPEPGDADPHPGGADGAQARRADEALADAERVGRERSSRARAGGGDSAEERREAADERGARGVLGAARGRTLADADGDRCEGVGRGRLLDGERKACGHDADGRRRARLLADAGGGGRDGRSGRRAFDAGLAQPADRDHALGDTDLAGCEGAVDPREAAQGRGPAGAGGGLGETEPAVGREADGVPRGVDRHRWPAGRGEAQYPWEPPRTVTDRPPNRRARLKALGNAVVPQCAEVVGYYLIDLIARGAG
jgi:DNA (cytosine-5)-methyltransferase 1